MDENFENNIEKSRKLSEQSKSLTTKNIVFLVFGGVIVGFISGLFGGGGGILVVPLLTYFGKLNEKQAHATSILVILPIAIVSMATYLITGIRADGKVGATVAIGTLIGGLIGTFLLRKLSSSSLKLLFYIIMIVAGVRMLI